MHNEIAHGLQLAQMYTLSISKCCCTLHGWIMIDDCDDVLVGTAAAAPPPISLGDPALCGSHDLVTPCYYCRLGDFLCFCICVCVYCIPVFCVVRFFWVFFTFVMFFPSVL